MSHMLTSSATFVVPNPSYCRHGCRGLATISPDDDEEASKAWDEDLFARFAPKVTALVSEKVDDRVSTLEKDITTVKKDILTVNDKLTPLEKTIIGQTSAIERTSAGFGVLVLLAGMFGYNQISGLNDKVSGLNDKVSDLSARTDLNMAVLTEKVSQLVSFQSFVASIVLLLIGAVIKSFFETTPSKPNADKEK